MRNSIVPKKKETLLGQKYRANQKTKTERVGERESITTREVEVAIN